ncbi:hypothetical protein ACF09I_34535 [Streptomyces sp. NPDC014940]|uniref:hypothetical protein n=1 Tax=Streptomyces sp. NPDC014940 TaxID=3364932 RepID=UPI0036F652E9
MVKTVALTALEVLCLLLTVYGVALIYLPAGYILAGLMGVVAVEKKLAKPPSTQRKGARQ